MRFGHAKKNLLLFFLSPLLLGFILAAIIYALDPFALFGQRGVKIGVLNDMRIQSAGAIHSTEFDSIILGTSILENTSAKTASNILGGNFINLSVSGSTFYERHFILDYALKQRPIKSVIYSMDSVYTNPVYEMKTYPASRFDYLYNDEKWDNIRAYADFTVWGCVFKNKFGSSCMGEDYEFDRPNAWMILPEHSIRFGGVQNWLHAKNNHQIIEALTSIARDIDRIKEGDFHSYTDDEKDIAIQTAIDYIDRDIIRYVRAYPDTQFHLVFPPYSRIVFAQWYQLNHMDVPVYQAVLRYLTGLQNDLPNLYIYGYDDMDFLDDIANYKDTIHFHPRYNDMILQSIKDGTHRLASRNINTYINTARRKAIDYDLTGLGDSINAYLEDKKD